MAYVDIKKGDIETIRRHAVRVFGSENYKLAEESAGELVFERPATRHDRVMYGTPGAIGGGRKTRYPNSNRSPSFKVPQNLENISPGLMFFSFQRAGLLV